MSFIQENIGQILGYLFGAGGISAFIFERKKNKAETKIVEADATEKEIGNSSKVVDLYKQALDDLENRYEKKYQEVTALYERKIKVLEDEIKILNRRIIELKKENTELRTRLKNANNYSK